jgi:hypothetical protein
MINYPEFLVTRFTHGSAGKFLSSVLQTSTNVEHWSAILESYKSNDLFEKLVLEHTNRSFPKDHTLHLQHEPMVPYNTDLYSVGYPRGNDVTLDQYIENAVAKNDTRLLTCIDNNRLINLVFNKPNIPIFCQGSRTITITVTTAIEKQWLYKTLWSKHFLETSAGIHYLPSDPEYCSFHSLPTVLYFNNRFLFSNDQKEQLYQDYIINNHTNSWYFDPDRFAEFDKTRRLNNVFVELDTLLTPKKFITKIQSMFDTLQLDQLNLNLIQQMHQLWLSRQISYDL